MKRQKKRKVKTVVLDNESEKGNQVSPKIKRTFYCSTTTRKAST